MDRASRPANGHHSVEKVPISRPFKAMKRSQSCSEMASIILGKIAMRTFGISAPSRSAISEVELDRLLDAVKKAIQSTPQDFLSGRPLFDQPPEHANNNGLEWPLLPFPEAWDGDY